jgi:hypothetical protein
MGVDFCKPYHFSLDVTLQAKLVFTETLRVLSSAARFASLTSRAKLACDEVKGVTHFEKAVVFEGMLWLK